MGFIMNQVHAKLQNKLNKVINESKKCLYTILED